MQCSGQQWCPQMSNVYMRAKDKCPLDTSSSGPPFMSICYEQLPFFSTKTKNCPTWRLSHSKSDVRNVTNDFDKSRRHFFYPPDCIIVSFNECASSRLSHSVSRRVFQPFLNQGTFFRWQRSQGTPPNKNTQRWSSVNNILLLIKILWIGLK